MFANKQTTLISYFKMVRQTQINSPGKYNCRSIVLTEGHGYDLVTFGCFVEGFVIMKLGKILK
jgi:hypothetical protein